MKEKLEKRFLAYLAIPSQSDNHATTVPSSPGQWDMIHRLEAELRELGLAAIHVSEFACLTAQLPATPGYEDVPAIGFCAHVDTVDVNLSPEIHPQIIRHYQGGPIPLGVSGLSLDPEAHPELNDYIGDDIICTDGRSVLGADDKAALTSIMTALETIIQEKRPHGDIYIAFLPDEEIGLRGAKKLELDRFPAAYAYTLDCCGLGEIVYETFNAGNAYLTIYGQSAHPMSAKGQLVNPFTIATDLAALLPPLESPENTEGTEGYYWLKSCHATPAKADIFMNIRDHDKTKYEARKQYLRHAVALLQEKYPRAKIELRIEDIYGNIKDALNAENKAAIDHLYTAMNRLGIEPKTIAMRGGTDGSYLSACGLLTPNFFTGGHNFHSPYEFIPLGPFEKACQMVLELVALACEK